MWGSIYPAHADRLPLQVADRPDPVGAEQLKAADVDPSQDHDRRPLVQLNDELRGEVAGDVCLAGAERLVEPLRPERHVLHVRKALASQQVFRHILGGPDRGWNCDAPSVLSSPAAAPRKRVRAAIRAAKPLPRRRAGHRAG